MLDTHGSGSQSPRGCTLGGDLKNIFKGRKSVILGVWGAPGAAQNPKMTDFRSLQKLEIFIAVQGAATSTLGPSAVVETAVVDQTGGRGLFGLAVASSLPFPLNQWPQ